MGCEAEGEAGPHSLGLAEAEEGVGLLARKQRGRGFFLFYFVFKTKFNYEPNANSNRVSNILFYSNKNGNFGKFSKINFTSF